MKTPKQQFKKDLITVLAIATILTVCVFTHQAKAQSKTPVTITQDEAKAIGNNLYKAEQILHRLDVPALKRDSIDLYIGQVQQFIYDRNLVALKADTAKSKAVKKN